ncbi:hypothetical protein B0H11DRAFT_2222208 [Mycena galericulata]|nr:hypothetical protein B0H11DRAFT_2222208 [Mycena galericulata]
MSVLGDMDKDGYDLLLELADDFITKKEVGQVELAEGMMAIFGDNYSTSTAPEVLAFCAYFSAIQTYEEAVRSGDNPVPDRPAPPPFSNGDSMDIDPVQPSTQLTNAALQATTLSIKDERAQRLIDNVSPRVNANRGRALNSLTARLLIERPISDTKSKIYCVGCLKESANKVTDRVHKHAISCIILARDFPTELQEVKDALAKKATPNILQNNGHGAPRVRTQARNAADPYFKRTPVPGISPSGSGASTPALSASGSTPTLSASPDIGSTPTISPAPTQTTLEDNWGAKDSNGSDKPTDEGER